MAGCMLKSPILAIGLLVYPSDAMCAIAYVCIPLKAAGFSFDKASAQWTATNFSVAGKRYLLKKQPVGWARSNFGELDIDAKCDDVNHGGYVFCHGITGYTI